MPLLLWHPMLVHFPIVLVLAAAVADLGSAGARRWLWPAAALSAAAAAVTGLLAAPPLRGPWASALAWHRDLGLMVVAAAGARCALRQPWGRRLATALAVAGVLAAGELGGQLVYGYGIGVRPRAVSSGAVANAGRLLYAARCARCHGPLDGPAPMDRATLARYGGSESLARFIAANMPPDGPHPTRTQARQLAELLLTWTQAQNKKWSSRPGSNR